MDDCGAVLHNIETKWLYDFLTLEKCRNFSQAAVSRNVSQPAFSRRIFIADGKMLFTSDDGESLYQIPDNIYIADITEVPYTGLKEGVEPVRDTPFSVKLDKSGKVVTRKGSIAAGAKAGKVELFREMSDFRRAGEIEGLSIDPVNDDLVVLNNRGTQIILGMSQGPFTEEGYKGEIHELYIYEKIK